MTARRAQTILNRNGERRYSEHEAAHLLNGLSLLVKAALAVPMPGGDGLSSEHTQHVASGWLREVPCRT